jgi:hypothetical protein
MSVKRSGAPYRMAREGKRSKNRTILMEAKKMLDELTGRKPVQLSLFGCVNPIGENGALNRVIFGSRSD